MFAPTPQYPSNWPGSVKNENRKLVDASKPSIVMLARSKSTFFPSARNRPFTPTMFVLEFITTLVAEMKSLGRNCEPKKKKKLAKELVLLIAEPQLMIPELLKLPALRRRPAPVGPVSNSKPVLPIIN